MQMYQLKKAQAKETFWTDILIVKKDPQNHLSLKYFSQKRAKT